MYYIIHMPVTYILFVLFLDFTKQFDWNTKELFVYAVATYETDAHVCCVNRHHEYPSIFQL